MEQAKPVALNLDNDELFVIERLQYGAQQDIELPGGGGSSNCNCNSNCNGSSEEPIA